MPAPFVIKNYSDCYQYGVGNYEKNVYKFFIESKVIDKVGETFDDIRFSIKKMAPAACVADTLDSPNVVLLYHSNPLPRAFKVFTAKDLKSSDNQLKVFIDMSDIISTKTGSVTVDPRNIDKLVSFLTSAMMMRIYYSPHPDKLFNSVKLMKTATECFAEMFTYVIDWLRISGAERMREKCMYMSSLYFNMNVLGREYTSSIESMAKQISKITTKDIEVLDIMLPENTYTDLNGFIQGVSKVIRAEGLKLDNFIGKWIHLFGPGTQFGVEYFPAFSSILTNVYNGSYLVTNQKTVERICGRNIVDYTTTLLSIGSQFN